MAWVWRSWWTVASTPAARAVVIQLVSLAGAAFYYGRRLYGDVRAAGLVEVDAAGRVQMIRAGTAWPVSGGSPIMRVAGTRSIGRGRVLCGR